MNRSMDLPLDMEMVSVSTSNDEVEYNCALHIMNKSNVSYIHCSLMTFDVHPSTAGTELVAGL